MPDGHDHNDDDTNVIYESHMIAPDLAISEIEPKIPIS